MSALGGTGQPGIVHPHEIGDAKSRARAHEGAHPLWPGFTRLQGDEPIFIDFGQSVSDGLKIVQQTQPLQQQALPQLTGVQLPRQVGDPGLLIRHRPGHGKTGRFDFIPGDPAPKILEHGIEIRVIPAGIITKVEQADPAGLPLRQPQAGMRAANVRDQYRHG